jgi:hypothetical protein
MPVPEPLGKHIARGNRLRRSLGVERGRVVTGSLTPTMPRIWAGTSRTSQLSQDAHQEARECHHQQEPSAGRRVPAIARGGSRRNRSGHASGTLEPSGSRRE